MISNRTLIEISKENLVHNVNELKKMLPEKTLSMAVTKSNAYGHGILLCGKALQPHVDYFGVDDVEEAIALRENGITKPILVFGYTPETYFEKVKELDIELTATCNSLVKKFIEAGVKFHLKLETGLGRQGMIDEEFESQMTQINTDLKNNIMGVYSHFASAENNSGQEYSLLQFQNFSEKAKRLEDLLGKKVIKHMSATSGNLMNQNFALDMVRFGLGLYGLYPSQDVKEKALPLLARGSGGGLKPVLTWKAVVSEIKQLPKGHFVGYDQTHKLHRDSLVGIVPVGYWHGIPRSYSNVGYVMTDNKRAPVLGRVSMDMIVVDLTDVLDSPLLARGVRGEVLVATIIGEGISAEEFAKLAGTINYEVVTRINPLIKRVEI